MSFELQLLHGPEIQAYIEPLAELRLTVFNEFPYLYKGSLDYEMKYLGTYVKSKNSLTILAKKNDKVIGASTCIPLIDEVREIQQPYLDAGLDVSKICYFGESIILKEYRGQKVGSDFFKIREEHAQSVIRGLQRTSFCAVIRQESHPLKPKTYKSLDSFWARNGYQAFPKMKVQFKWLDVDKEQEDYKDLLVWMKSW